ncbi:MAG: ABC transporter substrate-binding protein [Betaproteobacteria bacterium]|nr:ABC transporter substrate-binding protein [Betaproteobacteria bacterium]MDE1982336.1 ABC transporter substrate-binding protein [Betaproteobacteria bacterium]MDE2211231.1 ABC transporter substrate-binding protein [Betaproteobacteria bacterium]
MRVLHRPLLLALTALTFSTAAFAGEIRIGLAEALTGPASQYGVPIRNGFLLAQEEINAKGGIDGNRIVLVEEDERGKKEEAINVYKKLIFQDKVLMVFGPTLSNSMFAAGPIANMARVVAFGTSNTASGITDIGPYIFRSSPMEADVVPVTLKAAMKHLGLHKVGIIYGNDDAFTKSGYDVFRQALQAQHIDVVDTETYSKGDVDFKAQLTKIKAQSPDAIVCPCLSEEGANILIQARALGIKAPFIGGNGFNTPKLLENAKTAAEGTIVGSPWFDGNPSPANQHFIAAYRKKYGADPNQFSAQGYDALFIVAEAIKKIHLTGQTDRDRQALRDALPSVQFAGATGHFAFRPAPQHGGKAGGYDADQTPFVYIVKNGKFALLK